MTVWRHICIYARVSKDKSAQTTEQQVEACRRFLGARADGAKVAVVEERESAGKARPALEDVMRRVRRREVDVVIVARFDRFARSARELLLALDEFNALGVAFLSAHEGIDPTTPFGRAVFTILAAVAELEKGLISARTKEKLASLKARGVKLGRPRIAIDEDRARRLVVDRGLSARKLARALGIGKSLAATVRTRILAVHKRGALEPTGSRAR